MQTLQHTFFSPSQDMDSTAIIPLQFIGKNKTENQESQILDPTYQ